MWTTMLKSAPLPMTEGRADNPAEHNVVGKSPINQVGILESCSCQNWEDF